MFVRLFADLEVEFLHSVIPLPPTPSAPASVLPTAFNALDIHSDTTAKEVDTPECVATALANLPDFSYLRKSILAFPLLDQTD